MITRRNILLAGGILAGAFFGLVAAVVLARNSPRVIDLQEASEVLQQPIDVLANREEVHLGPGHSSRSCGPVGARTYGETARRAMPGRMSETLKDS